MTQKKSKKIANQAPSLIKALMQDIFVRHWFVSAMALLCVVSGMMLALSSHSARRLTTEWQQLRQQHQSEQLNWGALRLELTSLREADRVSGLAKKQLGMIEVNSKNEKVISL